MCLKRRKRLLRRGSFTSSPSCSPRPHEEVLCGCWKRPRKRISGVSRRSRGSNITLEPLPSFITQQHQPQHRNSSSIYSRLNSDEEDAVSDITAEDIMFKWKASGKKGGGGGGGKAAAAEAAKLNNAADAAAAANAAPNQPQSEATQEAADSKAAQKSSKKDGSPSKGFRLFGGGSSSSSQNNASQQQQQQQQPPQPPQQQQQPNGILRNANYDTETLSRVGQRLAMSTNGPAETNGVANGGGTLGRNSSAAQQQLNLSHDNIYTGDNRNHQMAQQQQPKPAVNGWRPQQQQQQGIEDAPVQGDQLYGARRDLNQTWHHETFQQQQQQQQQRPPPRPQMGPPPTASRPSLGMASLEHWSSHGYLAKPPMTSPKSPNGTMGRPQVGNSVNDNGYVILKRQGDQLVPVTSPQGIQQANQFIQQQQQQQQPQSLPPRPLGTFQSEQQHPQQQQQPTSLMSDDLAEKKYFSVKGFSDMRSKHHPLNGAASPNDGTTVVAPADVMNKYYSVDARYNSVGRGNLPPDLKMKLRQVQEAHQHRQQQQQPPKQQIPQFGFQQQQQHAPPPPPRPQQQQQQQQGNNKSLSTSWEEWTKQLQAYIAWVNSQLRKRPDLRPVQDLRTDVQSGEVLAQLIEIISGEKVTGIQYNPESIQGMRENLERILKFMATRRIRMHPVTSREILEGNLKAVMRLILALAAHYKPQSVRHHDASEYHNLGQTQKANNEGNSPKVSVAATDQQQQQQLKRLRDQMDETQIEEISHNNSTVLNSSSNNVTVKRTASISSPRTNNNVSKNGDIYENVEVKDSKVEVSAGTQTEAKSPLQQQQQQQLQREDSFVRTGSGRKLPKLPSKPTAVPKEATEVKPVLREKVDDEATKEAKVENRKSKPKALQFWESLVNPDKAKDIMGPVDDDDDEDEFDDDDDLGAPDDFRYNTIHRMSMGRRMLPRPPNGAALPTAAQRSQSLDRNGELAAATFSNSGGKNNQYLNASFSGPPSLPTGHNGEEGGERGRSRSRKGHSVESDDAKDVAKGDGGPSTTVAQPGQPSPPSSDSRGEVEGSSDNNSPPTSVIQGLGHDVALRNGNPALDWLRGTSFDKDKDKAKTTNGFHSLEEEVMYLRGLQRAGDGNSGGGSSKHSDSMSDSGQNNNSSSNIGGKNGSSVPYEVLLKDLTQTKRQLLELHNLLISNAPSPTEGDQATAGSENRFSQCVSHIRVLSMRLKQSEHRCRQLSQDLERAQDEIKQETSSDVGPLPSHLGPALQQSLAQATLAKQGLEQERRRMATKIAELEEALQREKEAKAASAAAAAAAAGSSGRFEDFVRRKQQEGNVLSSTADLRTLYEEELSVARDAISNLRTSFNDSDPNQHILDTLEQCISVIIEKIQTLEDMQQQQQEAKAAPSSNNSRLSSLDYNRANDVASSLSSPGTNVSITSSSNGVNPTKILYFTNRSVTPFMTSIAGKKIGEITLRDFKTLFDRPGYFRFHFKAVDQEFGMVKEEITQDDAVLPGTDGKIVAWVDED